MSRIISVMNQLDLQQAKVEERAAVAVLWVRVVHPLRTGRERDKRLFETPAASQISSFAWIMR